MSLREDMAEVLHIHGNSVRSLCDRHSNSVRDLKADVERYRALHEAERGVCEQHCDAVRDLKDQVEWMKALILRAITGRKMDTASREATEIFRAVVAAVGRGEG